MRSTRIRRALMTVVAALALTLTPQAAAQAATPTTSPAALAAPAGDPAPDCEANGGSTPCWEYRTWYWTYANCESAAHQAMGSDSRYDNYVCSDHGLTVYLWLHRAY